VDLQQEQEISILTDVEGTSVDPETDLGDTFLSLTPRGGEPLSFSLQHSEEGASSHDGCLYTGTSLENSSCKKESEEELFESGFETMSFDDSGIPQTFQNDATAVDGSNGSEYLSGNDESPDTDVYVMNEAMDTSPGVDDAKSMPVGSGVGLTGSIRSNDVGATAKSTDEKVELKLFGIYMHLRNLMTCLML